MPFSIWCRGRFIGEEPKKREAYATARLAAQLDHTNSYVFHERGGDEADMIAEVRSDGAVEEFGEWQRT